jgi:hypothetical protein
MVTETKAITVTAPVAQHNGSARKALTQRKGGSLVPAQQPDKLAAAGFALMREQLSEEVAQHFVVAAECASLQCSRWLSLLGPQACPEYIAEAKRFYRSALPRAARVERASDVLYELQYPPEPISHEQARAMLHFLFASTGKRRDEVAAMCKLSACVDIFSPTDQALGRALRLWQLVPQHPTVLALAIKHLRASKIFEPEESELREAMSKAIAEIRRLGRHVDDWVDQMRATDALTYETDLAGWRAAHKATDLDTVCVLLRRIERDGSSTPYSKALSALFDEKEAAEWAEHAAKSNGSEATGSVEP